jgi:hypothetical protein
LRAVISITGRGDQPVAPGQQLPIPYPSLTSALDVFGERFEKMFGANSQYAQNGVRGPKDEPGVAQPATIGVVAGWGPVLLMWPNQGNGKAAWTVSVADGTAKRAAVARQNYALIDVARDCPAGCTLDVANDRGVTVLSVKLVSYEIGNAPHLDWLGPLDRRENRALYGAWLTDALSDETWNDEGLSLMWSAACTFPAVRLHLKPYFGRAVGADEACNTATLSFKN